MVYGLQDVFISNKDYEFNKLTNNNDFIIQNNLNIKFNLDLDDVNTQIGNENVGLQIINNGSFKSNINIKNYKINISESLQCDNFIITNTKLKIKKSII